MALSETEKLQLIRALGNEAEFRETLLLPLFRQMKKYEHVDYTHGANERGKDFVLIGRDELAELTYTAVVVKCRDITNTTDGRKNESVANVCTQVAASINSGYSCTLQNRDVTFNKILVITNGSISHSAKEEIVKLANTHKFTKVSFKSGQDLVTWVDSYLPEFYTTSSGLTSAYLGELRKKCERLDELKTIAKYKGEARRLLDVFVSPTLYRVPTSIKEDSQPKPVYEKLERIVHQKGHIMILGGPGSGKSTLLRAQVQRLIDGNTRGQITSVPVFVRAADLIKYKGSNLEGLVNAYVQDEYALKDFKVDTLMGPSGHTVFIFVDGLEEVHLPEERARLAQLLRNFADNQTRHKLILSSRDTSDLDGWSIPKAKQWNLMPMKTQEVKAFILKWFNDQSQGHPLLKALQDHEILAKLPKTPLVVTLLAILFDQPTPTEVPANLAELYQMFVELLLGRWNLDRKLSTFYTANIRRFMLWEIAHHMHTKGVVSISLPALHFTIHKWAEHLGADLNAEEVALDLIDTTGLLVINDKGHVEFRHLSFQEFLVAEKFAAESTEDVEEVMTGRFGDEWWSSVVYHYCGLKRQNPRLLSALTAELPGFGLIPGLRASWTFGYIVQASYLTALDVRYESVKAFLRYYSEQLTKIVEEQPTLEPFSSYAPALLVISFIEVFKLHYSSKYMIPVLTRVFQDFQDGETATTFAEKLAVLIAASTLTNSTGSPDKLLDVSDTTRGEPILDLALNFQLNYQLDTDDLSLTERKDVRRAVHKLQRKFREGVGAYRAVTSSPKSRLAASESPDEVIIEAEPPDSIE